MTAERHERFRNPHADRLRDLALYSSPKVRHVLRAAALEIERLEGRFDRGMANPNTIRSLRPAEIPAGHKWCSCCDMVKPLDQFSKNRARRDGVQAYCRNCFSRRQKWASARRTEATV